MRICRLPEGVPYVLISHKEWETGFELAREFRLRIIHPVNIMINIVQHDDTRMIIEQTVGKVQGSYPSLSFGKNGNSGA